MPFLLSIDFDVCSPTPANGYNIQYRIAGSLDPLTDAGNFFSSPAGIIVDTEDDYEGIVVSDCGGDNLGSEVPFSTVP